MAVYTDVSDEDLAAFVALYDIGDTLALKGIAEGVENSNFLLHTTSGYFILTLYEKRVNPADLPFFLELMRHLAARGISCPQPIAARSGAMLGELAGRPAAIISFLDGMWVRRPKREHCAELGEALARFHLAGADFAGQRPNTLSVDSWRPLLGASLDQADTVVPGLAAELTAELDHLESRWPTVFPPASSTRISSPTTSSSSASACPG